MTITITNYELPANSPYNAHESLLQRISAEQFQKIKADSDYSSQFAESLSDTVFDLLQDCRA